MLEVVAGDVLLPGDERGLLDERERDEGVGRAGVGVGVECEEILGRDSWRAGCRSHGWDLPFAALRSSFRT